MQEKNKKRQIAKISVFITSIFVIFLSVTYAFITQVLTSTKEIGIKSGILDLVLEEETAITISDAYPKYDEVGMIQEDVFEFRLVNKTNNPTNYVLKLKKVETTNELSLSDVKYYLTKEGVGQPKLLSSLPSDGTVDSGKIEGNDTIDYTLRLWIDSKVTDNNQISGKSLSYKINAEASMIPEKQTVTFAGITKEVNETIDTMFNYTSEGVDPLGGASTDATNGIYAMKDDDDLSYFYRGEVDNLVKFGSYTKDYYVYRYDGYDFPSLEACKFYNSNCSESNKVLKYAASDNVPMYWRIVRINGDRTIRMIYAGTSIDSTGYDTGIGISRYNEGSDDPKYVGYTYDRTIKETKSDAKTEIDNWYKNVFEGTEYDGQIVTGKFCSDSSGYEYDEVATQMFRRKAYTYGGFRRNFANMFGRGNASPSFKCSDEMNENIGGNYSLKAGLITLDEIIAAGGQATSNNSYYLYNGTKGNNDGKWFWSMSPAIFNGGSADVGFVDSNSSVGSPVVNFNVCSLRPVINLRSDILFKSGTDGSTTSPYEIELEQ